MIAARTDTAHHAPAAGLLAWRSRQGSHALFLDEYSHPGIPFVHSNTTTGCPAGLRRIDVRPRSTGKERDSETGLDFFGARYFSGAQGRFTSPDSLDLFGHLSDPQAFNKYAYTRNNPLRYVDPNGKDWRDVVNDLKTIATNLYVKVTVGGGAEVSPRLGPVEFKGAISANANFGIDGGNVSLSQSLNITTLSVDETKTS